MDLAMQKRFEDFGKEDDNDEDLWNPYVSIYNVYIIIFYCMDTSF